MSINKHNLSQNIGRAHSVTLFFYSFSPCSFHSIIRSPVPSSVHSFPHPFFSFTSFIAFVGFLQVVHFNSFLPSSPTIPISKLVPIVMSHFWNFRPGACRALPGMYIYIYIYIYRKIHFYICMLVKANIPFNMMNCRMQDTSPEVPRVERNDCWNQPIPWASVPTFMFVIFRFSFACGTATITFNLLWCLPTYKVPRPYLNWIINKCVIQPGGLDALLQPHPGREREKESRNSVSGRSAHLRAFRPPWMVMAGEKSGRLWT